MKSKIKVRDFDAAAYLETPEQVLQYLRVAFDEGDADDMVDAIGVAARSTGMAQIAERTGLARTSLYRSLSEDGHPEFATVVKVLHAMGLKVALELDA